MNVIKSDRIISLQKYLKKVIEKMIAESIS